MNKNLKLKTVNMKYKTISYGLKKFTFDLESFLNRFLLDIRFRGKIAIITKLKSSDGNIFTIGSRTILDTKNKQDINNYLFLLKSKYDLLEEFYKKVHVIKVYFNYTQIIDQNYERLTNLNNIKNLTPISKKDQFLNINKLYNLPLNMDYITWGKVIQTIYTQEGIFYKIELPDGKILEVFKLKTNYNRIILYYNNSYFKSILDKPLSSGIFVRDIGDKLSYIHNNKIIFNLNTKFKYKDFSKLSKNKQLDLNIITLEIRTYLDSENIIQLYCISMYDGVTSKSFHLTEYYYVDNLIQVLIKDLFVKHNSGKTIYIHNFSHFNIILFLKHLADYENVVVNPIIRDGKFVNIEIIHGNIKIYLKDSYLLLPVSLSKLAKQFGVEQQKLDFDHNKITKNNLLKFKDEVIKYCIADCILLYKVIVKFNKKINSFLK